MLKIYYSSGCSKRAAFFSSTVLPGTASRIVRGKRLKQCPVVCSSINNRDTGWNKGIFRKDHVGRVSFRFYEASNRSQGRPNLKKAGRHASNVDAHLSRSDRSSCIHMLRNYTHLLLVFAPSLFSFKLSFLPFCRCLAPPLLPASLILQILTPSRFRLVTWIVGTEKKHVARHENKEDMRFVVNFSVRVSMNGE